MRFEGAILHFAYAFMLGSYARNIEFVSEGRAEFVKVSSCFLLDHAKSDGMTDGMQTMTHRTTFALDEATAQRLKRLAAQWQVSQAEVVRRSLEQAEKLTKSEKPDPIALLRRLHEKGGGLDRKKADAYLAEVHEDRKRWRGQ
jgi:hypothetical protein